MSDDEPTTMEAAIAAENRAVRPLSDERPLSALCISGGGIRSATFGLGAIQGLAERGLLEQFDYLSTVSGGGYIGGWLTAWKNRVGGLQNVVARLRRDGGGDVVASALPHSIGSLLGASTQAPRLPG